MIDYFKSAQNALIDNDLTSFEDYIEKFDIEKKNSFGETLLWESARNGLMKFAKLLLDHGANANTCDKDGWTPLHIAVQNQDINMVKLLLKYKADVNATNKFGNNAVWIGVFYANGETEIISLLLEFGGNPCQENKFGVSALQLAQTISNYDNLSIFKKYGY